MKKINFILVFIGVILASCTKSDDRIITPSITDTKKEMKETSHLKSITLANPNNPYDYIGEYHNEVLDFIAENHLNDLNESNYCNIVSAVKNEYNITEEFTCSTVTQSIEIGRNNTFNSNNEYDSTFFFNMYNSGDISFEAYSIINSTINEVSSLIDLSDKINYIKSIENNLSTNTTLINSELKSIQSSLAIYKYSSYYWSNQGNSDNFNVELSYIASAMDAHAEWYAQNCNCPPGLFEDGSDIYAFSAAVSAVYDIIF